MKNIARPEHLLFLTLTLLFCELVEQAGLADAHVTDDDVFEDEGVVVGPRTHPAVDPPLFCPAGQLLKQQNLIQTKCS